MANCQQFGGDFEFEGASQGNISEISFPSHVSGLESFSDFDKSFQGFQDERSSSQTAAPAKILGAPEDEIENASLRLSLPLSIGTTSPASAYSDTADMSSGLFDLKTPNTQREEAVLKFLSQDRNSEPLFVKDDKHSDKQAALARMELPSSLEDSGDVVSWSRNNDAIPNEERPKSRDDESYLRKSGFDVAIEINQRPGLDGSSSDSEDGATLNFARSRIGTVNQQHLAAFLDDREQDSDSGVLEERQLAEGDDVFSRDVPGDGGGGGDGSSGHSDSDIDGDGGVAIRVRSRRSQRARARTTAAIQPLIQQNEELPERERPVGDSVPAFGLQARSQIQIGHLENAENSQYNTTPRSDPPATQDVDSSQDSRLSARFFIASSTPGGLLQQNSVPQNVWTEESTSFQFSESAPVSPGNGDEASDTLNFNSDSPSFDSFGSRNVVGNDDEGDKTLTDATHFLPREEKDSRENDLTTDLACNDKIFRPSTSGNGTSRDSYIWNSTNPLHQASGSLVNPFSSFACNKNPFDPLDISKMQDAFTFSGFDLQNSVEIGDSSFKVNSQDAKELFDEDEKSFQHSNTISRLANASNESVWSLEDAENKGEVRLSKYFNAMSEELGTMNSDRPDRPRPVFDDYRVVKTPPALHPIILHAGGPEESSVTNSFSFDTPIHSEKTQTSEQGKGKSGPVSKLSSTMTISNPFSSNDSDRLMTPEMSQHADVGKERIHSEDGAIEIPKTNDEAECLLHDIGVGRVSLRGISGVNVSNLAAKIAVATNSDPNFILRLLVSLIQGEEGELSKTTALQKDAPRKQTTAGAILPSGQSSSVVLEGARDSSCKSSVALPDSEITRKKTVVQGQPTQNITTHSQSGTALAGKDDQSALKLSDLDKTLTPVKINQNASEGKGLFSANIVPAFGNRKMHTIAETVSRNDFVAMSSQHVVQPQVLFASQDQIKTTSQNAYGLGIGNKSQQKSISNQVNTIPHSTRPVSSVMPLVALPDSALPDSRALYRDSGVQCLDRRGHHQSIERGASFERVDTISDDRTVSTADAAIQCDVPTSREDFRLEADTLHQIFSKSSHAVSNKGIMSSLKTSSSRHLSSTAIFGEESSEQPNKAITLSPIASNAILSFLEKDEVNWKPLKASNRDTQVQLSESQNSIAQYEKPFIDTFSDEDPKFMGNQIEDILPRKSDVNVRESNVIFRPLVGSNQTVVSSSPPASSVQEQKLPVQQGQTPAKVSHLNESTACSADANSMQAIQIIVPKEVCFAEVQCIGVAVNECLPIHNPSSQWIQCILNIVFHSVNGDQADVNSSCSFGMQPKVFIAPHTTEDVKVTFHAQHPGVYMAKVNVIPSPVVTDESTVPRTELYSNVVHIEGIAEQPDIEVVLEDSNVIDFGEMPADVKRTRSLKLRNRGRADVPLKLVLSGHANSGQNFGFVVEDLNPTEAAGSNSPSDANRTQPSLLNVILPGSQQKGEDAQPEIISIQFTAPHLNDRGLQTKLGPAKEHKARVDIEVDTKAKCMIIGSVLLKAIVGTARLHAPRSLQAISLSTTEGHRVSRGIPFRNAGNISLEIQLQVSLFTNLFSVVPDIMKLSPGQSSEVFIHFMSMSSVTVESSLLVSIHPDGPQYEVALRGTSTTPSSAKEKEEKPVLLCTKPILCWAGIPIGRSMQQRAYLRNNSMNTDLQITLSVEGCHTDFQVQNTFDFKERTNNALEVTLKPQRDIPIDVLFVPSTFGMISSALVIRTVGDGPKFKIPLHGYGGCSMLQLTDAQRFRDNYWIDAGEVSHERQSIVKLSLQNIGDRAAFVKIVCYADVSKRKVYPGSHISIAPNDFILPAKCTKQLVVVLRPTEAVLRDAKDKPLAVASLVIFSGDECMRQLYKRYAKKSSKLAIEDEGPLQNLTFHTPFVEEDKVLDDIEYPDIANWERFFVRSSSRTVVSLIARPLSKQSSSLSPSVRPLELDPKELILNRTPARALPVSVTSNDAAKSIINTDKNNQQSKETWAVVPEHIVLAANNTDKSTARIQMINYSDRPLGFEFSWPAKSLIITPSKESIPPRSQLIVFVSTKPSFLSTGGELPWRGCIYIQCEGVAKSVRVQIREDLALDSSPMLGLSKRLAPLYPSNTPFQAKQPIKPKVLATVEPTSVLYPGTMVNRFQESFIKIESMSSATLKWILSSIAPSYFKDMSETGDIFRATYTAFRFTRHSGQLQPSETTTVPVVFQPRDRGEYSQFWDLQIAVESTGETSKSRIELRGKGVYSEANLQRDDGKLVGQVHPILKPPDHDNGTSICAGRTATATKASTRINLPNNEEAESALKPLEKRDRGIFVKDDILTFKPTSRGETSELYFRLCNDTGELQKVRLSGLKPPFSMKLNKLAIKAKSFIRIPVYFTPTDANSKSEGVLEVSALIGSSQTSYVRLTGICHSRS